MTWFLMFVGLLANDELKSPLASYPSANAVAWADVVPEGMDSAMIRYGDLSLYSLAYSTPRIKISLASIFAPKSILWLGGIGILM